MKAVNLKSLLAIYDKNGSINIPVAYMNYLCGQDYKLKINGQELNSLKGLIATLENNDSSLTSKDFNSFYIGYTIPQIGKEFDLLRISKSMVLNIEYKRQYTDGVEKQLFRNNYYLNFLNREMKLFTYVEQENELYKLNENNKLIHVNYQELIEVIKNQCGEDENFYEGNLNELFEPSNYLISPFRKTEEFIKGEYFLTKEQEEIERDLIQEVNNGGRYFLITGSAGSGKTLLTYHFAKAYKEKGFEVGIIHCGNLNIGHEELKRQFEWNIQPIKYWKNLFNDKNPAVVIIDEIQRMNNKGKLQFFEMFDNYIRTTNVVLIMSGDERQMLKQDEGKVFEILTTSKTGNLKTFKLRGKIRTNKELADFIRIMLDLDKKKTLKASSQNIDIAYFNTIKEAENYISTKNNYDYISYTPSQIHDNHYTRFASVNPRQKGSSHAVVGQEFENVIVVLLGEYFYYDGNKLKTRGISGNPYSTYGMFFQQITRAINKLEIVIVNNIEVFNKLTEIFE